MPTKRPYTGVVEIRWGECGARVGFGELSQDGSLTVDPLMGWSTSAKDTTKATTRRMNKHGQERKMRARLRRKITKTKEVSREVLKRYG